MIYGHTKDANEIRSIYEVYLKIRKNKIPGDLGIVLSKIWEFDGEG